MLNLEPGADSGTAALLHTGHEFVSCLTGSIEYQVEERIYLLSPGDSLLFAAHLRHHWRNNGQGPAHVLILLSGYTESDRQLLNHVPKQTR